MVDLTHFSWVTGIPVSEFTAHVAQDAEYFINEEGREFIMVKWAYLDTSVIDMTSNVIDSSFSDEKYNCHKNIILIAEYLNKNYSMSSAIFHLACKKPKNKLKETLKDVLEKRTLFLGINPESKEVEKFLKAAEKLNSSL